MTWSTIHDPRPLRSYAPRCPPCGRGGAAYEHSSFIECCGVPARQVGVLTTVCTPAGGVRAEVVLLVVAAVVVGRVRGNVVHPDRGSVVGDIALHDVAVVMPEPVLHGLGIGARRVPLNLESAADRRDDQVVRDLSWAVAARDIHHW